MRNHEVSRDELYLVSTGASHREDLEVEESQHLRRYTIPSQEQTNCS